MASSLSKYASRLIAKNASNAANLGIGFGVAAATTTDPIDILILGTSAVIGLVPVIGNAIFALQMVGIAFDNILGDQFTNVTNQDLINIENAIYSAINKSLSSESSTVVTDIRYLEATPLIKDPKSQNDEDAYTKYILEYLDNHNLMLPQEAQAIEDAADAEELQDYQETLYRNILLIQRIKQRKYFASLLEQAKANLLAKQESRTIKTAAAAIVVVVVIVVIMLIAIR